MGSLSCVQLFVTPMDCTSQAPLSMGFSRREYWNGLPFPSLGHLPTQGSNPPPALEEDSWSSNPLGSHGLVFTGVFPFSSSGFPGGAGGEEPAHQCRRCRFSPFLGKIPWRKKCQPTPVFLPGKSHGLRSLVGYRPWSHKESDVTEHTRSTLEN